ncbi:hypothetical protein [Phormidium nigroviride]
MYCEISRRKKEEGRRKKEEGRRKKNLEEKFSYLGEKEDCLYSQLFSHPDLMFNYVDLLKRGMPANFKVGNLSLRNLLSNPIYLG